MKDAKATWTQDAYFRRLASKRELKSAMVDVHRMLIRPNRLQPTDDVNEMNRRSRALALQLKHSLGGHSCL